MKGEVLLVFEVVVAVWRGLRIALLPVSITVLPEMVRYQEAEKPDQFAASCFQVRRGGVQSLGRLGRTVEKMKVR